MNNSGINNPPFFTRMPYRTFRNMQRANREIGYPKDETFIEYEGSVITLPIRVTVLERDVVTDPYRITEKLEETLRLDAFMRLEVYPAYMNQQGTREFQFIIRDWELRGLSRVLTKIFKKDFQGYRGAAGTDPTLQTVMVTYSLSHHYIKHNDPEHKCLADVIEWDSATAQVRPRLLIQNMSNQWNKHNDILWRMTKAGDGKFHVDFYRLGYNDFTNEVSALPDLVASTRIPHPNPEVGTGGVPVGPGSSFVAYGTAGGIETPRNPKVHEPLEIHWAIGSEGIAEKDSKMGIIHQVAPPQSFCVADNAPVPGQPDDSADFPARVTYAASYNVFLNNVQILYDQAGVAMARNVLEIPPRNVLVAFEKPAFWEIADKDAPSKKRYRVEFGSGTCTGMVEISKDAWISGKLSAFSIGSSDLWPVP